MRIIPRHLSSLVARSFLSAAALVTGAAIASAGERFIHVPASALEFLGEQPRDLSYPGFAARFEFASSLRWPYVILEVPGEAWVDYPSNASWTSESPWTFEHLRIAIRAEDGARIKGLLFYPSAEEGPNGGEPSSRMRAFPFTVPETPPDTEARSKYFAAVEHHYGRLADRQLPGAAWFRHLEREAREQRGDDDATASENGDVRPFTRPRPELDDTYDLFTGGRALSENLQLDRLLEPAESGPASIDIASIPGIYTRELDWKSLVKDLKPEKDSLASLVPFDQHGLFFRSFDALVRVLDEADENGTPLLELVQARSDDAMTRARYERQLCLPLSVLGRALGSMVVSAVAVTGSDAELVEGSDVAVLFDCKQPQLVMAWITTRHADAVKEGAAPVGGELSGVAWRGVVKSDRTIASHVAQAGNVVVVSNSLLQLGRVLAAGKGSLPSLAAQDEYTFFRNRYPRSDASESALLVLSDATIRRWCSPQWRIGSSRRRRAASSMAELHARQLDLLAKGEAIPEGRAWDAGLAQSDDFGWEPKGVYSPAYGSLVFQNPIAELDVSKITPGEKAAYERFRERYQQNWRAYFDPIAVRLSVSGEKLEADLTVMPLIAGTDYREMIDMTRGKSLPPSACDPHEGTLFHVALAFNSESEEAKFFGGMAGSFGAQLGADPLSWIGGAVGFYAESDAFWSEWAGAESSNEFIGDNFHRLPLALHVEVKDALRLAAFLTAVRLYANQAGPNLTVWENRTYKDVTYVRLAASDNVDMFGELAIHYAALPDAFILTLREDVLQKAIDRRAARKAGEPGAAASRAWFGESVAMHAERGILEFLEATGGTVWRTRMQTAAWSNLPILNEWKHRYPDQDPVALHEKLWSVRLMCPGGGSYVWNEEFHTMESTVYGHPGAPKPGPKLPPLLERARSADFGLTFEKDGLRARGVLVREAR